MIVIVLFFTTLILAYIKWRIDNKDIIEFIDSLPGHKTWPFIGNAFLIKSSTKDVWKSIYALNMEFNSAFKFLAGPLRFMGIGKPEHAEVVLTNPNSITKGDVYEIMAECIGYGLIQTNNLKKHKIHRKLLLLPLRKQMLEKITCQMDEKSRECAEIIRKHVDGKQFNVIEPMELCVTALVTETIMGTKVKSEDEKNKHLAEILGQLYRTVAERLYKAWLHPYIIFRFSKNYQEYKKTEYFDEFIGENMDRVKQEVLEDEKANVPEEEFLNNPMRLMLHVKDDKNKLIFSKNDIYDEIRQLYSASEDTVATVASITLVMLAIHKNIQEEVWKEQQQIFGDDGNPQAEITMQHLDNMKYLHMVVSEALRLFPIGPTLVRKTTDVMKMDNYLIPKGVNIFINAFYIHRNPNVWSDPEKFDPLRFSPEEKQKRHPYAFIPFGGGIRTCIGKQYAFMGIKSFVSHIVRNYTLDTEYTMDTLNLFIDISVRFADGYKIKIKSRKTQN